MSNLIFINYRSCDEPYAAMFIDEQLTKRFGHGQVFRDSRTILPGTYFPEKIASALQQCQVLIAVIGRQWFSRDSEGRRLLDRPDDYVRLEIAVALRRSILVVPVLVENASLPGADDLPSDIAGLASRQYLHLGVRSADYDASRLVDELVYLLGGAGVRPERRVAIGRPPAAASSYDFHGLDARYMVFGNIYFGA